MEINAQLISFLTTLCIGIILGAIFDFYRVSRNMFKPRAWITWVFDALYWLVAIVITFIGLLFCNWAELRFYIFIGIMVGTLLYFKICSRYTVLFSIHTIKFCIWLVKYLKNFFVRFLLQPIGYLLGIFSTPFSYVKKRLKRRKKPQNDADMND